MEKKLQFKIVQSGEEVTVRVTVHGEFQKCVVDMPSPFKHGKIGLHPDIDPHRYQTIVVRCSIDGEERLKVAKVTGLSGESICHEIVEQFVKEVYGEGKAIQSETVFCNHHEMQYKYLVVPEAYELAHKHEPIAK
ncbi:hypothetical protein [Paraflavitalea sp. CAU 1676]|uniref:hypothetical protein n=1 Tax=Paraflavitalea sp. CAU 1676 TaxID=3032598 RepID=UPI0023DC5F08|nr:hypothetical protein [Paraflavitalea sp. CAU 1676]MDF2188694.1 hypothetical protein [Paraflavitalea sp. CAU 1676]